MTGAAAVRLERSLHRLVADGVFSAVVGLVGNADEVIWTAAAGTLRPESGNDGAIATTRFDLASLSKPFTASLALVLDASGDLPLALPIGEVWPGAARELAGLPLEALLRHRSGLDAWTPLYARCSDRAAVRELLLGGRLAGKRRGTYSDLGYILWALSAEEATGEPSARLLERRLLAPLGLERAGFEPPPGQTAACLLDTRVEVELAAARELDIETLPPPLPGRVQDGNARFLESLSSPLFGGHAGLFGDAAAVWRLAAEWLEPGRVLDGGRVEAALGGPLGRHVLGWARRVGHSRQARRTFSPRAFGHPGFTGGSVWADPRDGRVVVLLGHRRDPHQDLSLVRRRFHALAEDLFREAGKPAPP